MANRRGKDGSSDRFPLLGLKITADSDCSYEIRRWLLLGRRTVTNLDSVLKSRDISLLTKVHIVKAVVFPVVYSCESWTIKKAESQRIDAFELWSWRRPLKVPWTTRRSNQLIFFFFNFTILYWFCHISTWICHRYTRVPHPEPSSLLPPCTTPLGHPSAPAPSNQYHALNLD